MQNIHDYNAIVTEKEKDGQQSRFLLLDQMKHLPENEGVSFVEECRNQRT